MGMDVPEWQFVRSRSENAKTLVAVANATCPGTKWDAVDIDDGIYRHGRIRIISVVGAIGLTFDLWNSDGAVSFRAIARIPFVRKGLLVYDSDCAKTTRRIREWEQCVASELPEFVAGVLRGCSGLVTDHQHADAIESAPPYIPSGVLYRIDRAGKELQNVIEHDAFATWSRHYTGHEGERVHSGNMTRLALAISQLSPEDRETYRAVAVEESPVFKMTFEASP